MAGELGAGGQREQLPGLPVDLVAAEGEIRRDRGGELHGRVVGLRVQLAGLLGDALGGDLRAVAADRLVVVLEALQQVLDAGMALGVDSDHGAVHDGGRVTGRDRWPCSSGSHVTAPQTTSVPDMATIAALGTGVMGAPMARNLARAGHDVRAWNRSPEKAAPLRDDGVDVRDDPAGAAAGADVVLTMLADADAVLDVGRRTDLAEGQIGWQASTIGIEGIEQCASLAQETGAILVDAPVLGTRLPAEQGNLVVLASGPDSALDTLRAALRRGRTA